MAKDSQRTIMILGGDGYLGWSLGLALANRTDDNIVLVDSMVKRKWEKQVDAKVLVPLKSPKARIAAYKRLYGKDNMVFEKVELLDSKAVVKVISKYRPTHIINAAQQPSAPFSMQSADKAGLTYTNNIVGHLNVTWAIAQIDKSITYIKLGTAGCYMDSDTDFVPLGKQNFSFKYKGKQRHVKDAFIPMQATDFYHQSKITDLLIDDMCSRMWGLKVITVQQSTIFGATIKENHAPEYADLSARFNYDAVFSTVLNRFICQSVIGHPLTIYGDGKQKTGLISLEDTIRTFEELLMVELKPGEHQIVHNYTLRLTIEEVAQKIAEINPETKINYITNPRKEPDGSLSREVEIHSSVKKSHRNKEAQLTLEMAKLIEFTTRYKDNIDRSIIMPKVSWEVTSLSGNKPRKSWARRQLRQLRRHQPNAQPSTAE